jgi:excisionase family DNA binding protein
MSTARQGKARKPAARQVRQRKPAGASPPAKLYTVAEVATMCRLSEAMIWRYIRTGELRSLKLGWARRVPADAVDEFLENLEADQATDGAA